MSQQTGTDARLAQVLRAAEYRSARSRALAAEGVARWLELDAEQAARRGSDLGDQAAAWTRAGEAWYEAGRAWSVHGGEKGHKHAARCSRHAEDCSEAAADTYARWLTDEAETRDANEELAELDDEYGWEADCVALRQASRSSIAR